MAIVTKYMYIHLKANSTWDVVVGRTRGGQLQGAASKAISDILRFGSPANFSKEAHRGRFRGIHNIVETCKNTILDK